MTTDADRQPGRRIVVFGTSGSGKTYVAKHLAERLRIPYISSDAIIWGPNWIETPDEDRPALYDAATVGEAWTLDGNFLSTSHEYNPMVMRRADTLVWLDLPRHRVYRQVFWRTLKRSLFRVELWHGNRESFRRSFFSRDSILLWAVQTYPKRRQQGERFFADPPFPHLRLIRLRSRREVDDWLGGVVGS